MKIPKHNQKHRAGSVSLRGLLAQPPEGFYRLPDFAMRGGYLTTGGCPRVLAFGPRKNLPGYGQLYSNILWASAADRIPGRKKADPGRADRQHCFQAQVGGPSA